MLKFLRNPDVLLGASASLVVIVSALVGQYAARGMTPLQWSWGLTAIAASITLAVILRCWPAPAKSGVRAED